MPDVRETPNHRSPERSLSQAIRGESGEGEGQLRVCHSLLFMGPPGVSRTGRVSDM